MNTSICISCLKQDQHLQKYIKWSHKKLYVFPLEKIEIIVMIELSNTQRNPCVSCELDESDAVCGVVSVLSIKYNQKMVGYLVVLLDILCVDWSTCNQNLPWITARNSSSSNFLEIKYRIYVTVPNFVSDAIVDCAFGCVMVWYSTGSYQSARTFKLCLDTTQFCICSGLYIGI